MTLSGVVAATLVSLAPGSARAATLAAPTGLSPSGAVSTSTPTFTWNRVPTAVQYDIVVDDDPGFTSPMVSTTTSNNKFVPVNNLPDGPLFWEVRAISASATSTWSNGSATISPTAAPTPISPVGGVVLPQPSSPPLFTWSPVTGAVGYEIQVDNSGSWASPATATKGTSYFVNNPQAPGTWFWRVRANRGNGLFTGWSDGATYVVGPLADPQPGDDMSSVTPMQDVSLDWKPVAGATTYQLQIGHDPDFNNIVDDETVAGTRFQPDRTYDNDQYYWRVRAIDAGGNRMPWTTDAPVTFQRNWPDQPTLEYPANTFSSTAGDPMYYQWTAVRRASRYQLDVGSDQNFSPNTFSTCFVTSTTFPVNGACAPRGNGAPTYWRVRGLDDPKGVQGIYSAIHHFIYSGGKVTQVLPADGDTVDVPTLDWQAVPNAEDYFVNVTDKDGNQAAQVTTPSTSWTPEGTLSAAGSPYTWTVQSVSAQNVTSPLYPGHQFSVSGTIPTDDPALVPLTGLATDPATTDFPSLTWGAMSGAAYYRVRVGTAGSPFYDGNASHISTATYPYPAATDTGTYYLAPGDYFWYVDAYDGANHPIGETSPADYGQFTIKDLAAVSGQRVSLDGLASQSLTAGCSSALPAVCGGVPSTPVLSWDPQPGAAGYLVYIAKDGELTNRVVTAASTTDTVWTPPSDLPDNTSNNSYYWFVRPCKQLSNICNPDPISTHAAATNAFRKLSPAIHLTSPTDGASVTGEPTFAWQDYYDTNQAVSYAGGTDASYQTGLQYHVQISTSSTFASSVEDRLVDQPFFTPSDKTLPQGLLYWRVQAIDPNGDPLAWSTVRSLSNDQPAISTAAGGVASPVGGVTVSGNTPFRWAPQNGASQYQVEIYQNDDATHSLANRVYQGSTNEPTLVDQDYLPPSATAYRWRVRWFDADGQGQPRPWSSDGRFFVTASSVTLGGPTANTYQPNNGLYFTWSPVASAAAYRLDVRNPQGAVVYSITTPGTAFAPSTFGDGSFQWRVTALDPSNGAIANSAWRAFQIDSAAPVVTNYSPNPNGKPKSKVKITLSEPVSGVTTTSLALYVAGRGAKLPVKLKLSHGNQVATLTPKQKLKKGKSYTVKLTKAVHDGAGNHLVPFTWTFTV